MNSEDHPRPDNHSTRRSDRITIELDIQISGTDMLGKDFLEDTKTVVISRHGAKIVSKHEFVPEQEINILCLKTGQEAGARIIGQIAEKPDVQAGFAYGVGFLDPAANIWGIEFLPLANSQSVAGRALLECRHCHSREVAHLDDVELEVLEASKHLTRLCRRCTDTTLWAPCVGQAAGSPTTEPQAPSADVSVRRTRNDRKYPRANVRVQVCIQSAQVGEEVVMTENISKGGFRFKSKKRYERGWLIQAAVPYIAGAANVFVPAKIAYVEESGEEVCAYGVAYIGSPHV